MVSPVSATIGPKSPWPAVRKGSGPGPRRPPSPELTNLDCAFPPFPMPSRAPTTKRRERAATQRSDTKRSRSRDAQRPPRPDGRPFPFTRAGSSNNLAQMPHEKHQSHKQSRPSTPASSEGQSSVKNSDSRQPSIDKSAQAQAAPESQSSIPLPKTDESAGDNVPSSQILRTRTEPVLHKDIPIDHSLRAFNFGDTEANRFKPPNTNDSMRSHSPNIDDRPRAETEPAYKSKRPPPIASDRQVSPLTKMRSPTTPQPSSAGVLSKGLGRFFGRHRSQSASSRREVVRQALSDEPDVFENQFAGQSILSPDSDRSFLTAEPSPILTSPWRSPDPLPSHEESLKALEGLTPAPPAAPVVVIEPTIEEEEEASKPVPVSQPEIVTQPEPPAPAEEAMPERPITQPREALRRASIDSTSSYGSVGFSEHTASSRSSSPQTDSLASKSGGSHLDVKPSDVEVPAPLRPRLPALSPDSPTDPLFQQGRLSPIPDTIPRPKDLSGPLLHPVPNEPHAGSIPVQETEPATSSTKTKTATPNKGVCRGCSRVILAAQKSVSSADGRLTGRYHKECFVCRTCKATFPTAEFYVHSDQPYCAYHYHELENSLCATCGKGIEGLYMETANVAGRGKEKHHPECLKCTTCKVRLDHDYFELSGQVYCERDAFRQANLPKSRDNAPSRPSPLIREYISSGDPGLVKGRNFPERRTTSLVNMT
ncbi:uncharacterized protein Z518_10399 [Rhinocladiella mackenziei CBS 650.93]|uniref:LIM zinc-binding domain-containing protein n=1 Tax=Rhinocladiella mackenziei CBS 650.93 TaxID=1442369 RepID=A0A0D2IU41_9EURO|nr:uncharacterized protein Z518_10399 [Rhinocladiella mackenziei CBS 650.93]KIX00260.1 hypothetical protein Z518_10399 [Rhinocladiella mackenziei CBS 650.93]